MFSANMAKAQWAKSSHVDYAIKCRLPRALRLLMDVSKDFKLRPLHIQSKHT